MVGSLPAKDWKYTVPDDGVLVTSLKPQTRRILRPDLDRCCMTRSTSLSLVKKLIQYEFVPAKYPVSPSMTNWVPLVLGYDTFVDVLAELLATAEDKVVVELVLALSTAVLDATLVCRVTSVELVSWRLEIWVSLLMTG